MVAVGAARDGDGIGCAREERLGPRPPDGPVTQKIADCFLSALVPLADVLLDFHSGGKTLDFVPCATALVLDDTAQQADCVAAILAFNALCSMSLQEIDAVGMYDTAVKDTGKTFLSTKPGGGGTASARTSGVTHGGMRELLIHADILTGEREQPPSVNIDTTPDGCFHFAEADGTVELLKDLGSGCAWRGPSPDLVGRADPHGAVRCSV